MENGFPAETPPVVLFRREQGLQKHLFATLAAWQTHGEAVLERLATEEPAKFAQIAAGLVPRDILLSVTQRLPGNLEADDWRIAVQVFQAIRDAMPDASQRPPGDWRYRNHY
jgi:hypothetical protein